MKTTILIDNNAPDNLACEWGFSALIETDGPNGTTVLLDAGASPAFAQNADVLGIDLANVDYAVLSHAHFDHSDGMDAFLEANSTAPLLVQESCAENCYSDAKGDLSYIGVKRGLLGNYRDRIQRVSGVTNFAPGFWIVGHSDADLENTAFDPHMFLASGSDPSPSPEDLATDNFAHEQSLVADTDSGLYVFNSCSHSGVELIVDEVRRAFPGKRIAALVGGLHLFTKSDDEVNAVIDMIEQLGIERIYTGHCTGERALEIMQERLGDKVQVFESGLTFTA